MDSYSYPTSSTSSSQFYARDGDVKGGRGRQHLALYGNDDDEEQSTSSMSHSRMDPKERAPVLNQKKRTINTLGGGDDPNDPIIRKMETNNDATGSNSSSFVVLEDPAEDPLLRPPSPPSPSSSHHPHSPTTPTTTSSSATTKIGGNSENLVTSSSSLTSKQQLYELSALHESLRESNTSSSSRAIAHLLQAGVPLTPQEKEAMEEEQARWQAVDHPNLGLALAVAHKLLQNNIAHFEGRHRRPNEASHADHAANSSSSNSKGEEVMTTPTVKHNPDLYEGLNNIAAAIFTMEIDAYRLALVAPVYDFSPESKGNGYRSLLSLTLISMNALNTMLEDLTQQRGRLLFRAESHRTRLAGFESVIRTLARLITMGAKLGEMNHHSLFYPNLSFTHTILNEIESMSREAFYGAYLGYYLPSSIKTILKTIGLCMVGYSEGFLTSNIISATIFSSTKYFFNPSEKGKKLVQAIQEGSIAFTKSFWNLLEDTPARHLGRMIGPSLAVNTLLQLPVSEDEISRHGSRISRLRFSEDLNVKPQEVLLEGPEDEADFEDKFAAGDQDALLLDAQSTTSVHSLKETVHGEPEVALPPHGQHPKEQETSENGETCPLNGETIIPRINELSLHNESDTKPHVLRDSINMELEFIHATEQMDHSVLHGYSTPQPTLHPNSEMDDRASSEVNKSVQHSNISSFQTSRNAHLLSPHPQPTLADFLNGKQDVHFFPPNEKQRVTHDKVLPGDEWISLACEKLASVQVRLLSLHARQGQVDEASSNRGNVEGLPMSGSLILHFHGGGFVAHSSKSHEVYLRHWAKSLNVPIVSVDYKLAPECIYPSQIEECFYAYRWCLSNPDKLGWTGEKIIVTGDSAGGNLSASLTIRCIMEGVRVPDGVVMTYPALNLVPSASPSRVLSVLDPLLPYGILRNCLTAYTGVKFSEFATDDPLVSPLCAPASVLLKFPPTFIGACEFDPLLDDSVQFGSRLLALGCHVQLKIFRNMPHGFLQFPRISKEVQYANDFIIEQLRLALRV